jgi:glyoxylase-like metal-dependent hydrolase (beta-lactamase superfamily II)/ferredoxin
MADKRKSLPENADGLFYVDSTCINCGVSRHYAPAIFGDTGDFAYVKRQPHTDEETLAAKQALLACPVAAIGTRQKSDLDEARDSFPLQMAEDVYINGFNHRRSFGAHSYFIRSDNGNWLIDSPRFLPFLAEKFEAMGGIRYIFLTHSDDVCDAHKYAGRFGADRIIHRLEAHAQKDAELILDGDEVHRIDKGEIHFTPGHTAGHMVLLWDGRYLFSGDHYAFRPALNRFGSFRSVCWYSWEKQIESVRKMADFRDVEWVFPGHGKWGRVEKGGFPEVVRESVEWMERQESSK